MKAVVKYGTRDGEVELREVPAPRIGATDVLLETAAAGVCGSDVEQWRHNVTYHVNTPVVMGHEFCGTVREVGPEVTGFQPGDRVASETAASICGQCRYCLTGEYNLCPRRKGFGYGIDGAMASYVKVPARCLHRIPDTLPFGIACLAEPHAVAYNAMCVNSTIRPGDLVVVLGPGPIGLLCARMAALAGADPLVVVGLTSDAPRLETAMRLGATRVVDAQREPVEEIIRGLHSLGADLVCDASGASRPLDLALALARPDGQVTKVGWSPDLVPVNVNPLVQKNVRLQGSFSHNYPVWERVIHLLDRGLTYPEAIVGLTSPLGDWREAFDAMHSGRVIKSVLIP